jgi:hypothetical protein
MGLFTNPLGHAGYPPDATAPANMVNSTVRAATTTESQATATTTPAVSKLKSVYLSPATLGSALTTNLSSPPPIGDTAPNTIAATTLSSTGDTVLATAVTATSVNIANAVNTGALVVNIAGGANAADATVNILTGNATAGTQTFQVATGTRPASVRIATGAAANAVRIASSTSTLGFFGKAPAVQQTVALITNSVTTTGTPSTVINMTSTTSFGDSALSINENFSQIAQSLVQLTAAIRNLGLGA